MRIAGIEGQTVKLQLEGACGTCASSTATMKMGLEKRLKERIPEIIDVVQSQPVAVPVDAASIETVLSAIRPFLTTTGGNIEFVSLRGVKGMRQDIKLRMTGLANSLQSVKIEVVQRLQRHFPGVPISVEWER